MVCRNFSFVTQILSILCYIMVLSSFCVCVDLSTHHLHAVPFDSPKESHRQAKALHYLEQESIAATRTLNQLREMFRVKGIQLDDSVETLETSDRVEPEIALSTPENEIDCRVSLAPVPFGMKALAPCGCQGSQKWIQYSVYNKLRRKDPSHWKICKTCLKPIVAPTNRQQLSTNILGNSLSILLDRPRVVRVLLISCMIASLKAFQPLFLRLLVSRFVWQQYGVWNVILHAPLLTQFWIGKLLFSYLQEKYVNFEGNVISVLADIESSLSEPHLITTVDSVQ